MGRRALARIAAVAAGVAVLAGLVWGVTSVTVRMQEASGTPTGVAPVSVPGSTTAPVEPAPSETAPAEPVPVETAPPQEPQPVEPAPPAPAPPVDDDDDDDDDFGEIDDD